MPTELIATYRELVRLHSQLSDEIARYKNEIQALLSVLFPEFAQVFADPCRPTAIALLKLYPSAQAIAAAGVEVIATKLHHLAPRNYGHQTAEHLVLLAQQSSSSHLATTARSTSLKILCDQLEHTQTNLGQLEKELDKLLDVDDAVKGLKSTPEFGRKTVAVLRAELGDVARFQRVDLRGGLCWTGSRGETKWQMERASQALQTRQWAASPYARAFPLCARFA